MSTDESARLVWDSATRTSFRAARGSELSGEKAVLVAAMTRAERYSADQLLSRLADGGRGGGSIIQTALLKPVGDTCNIACAYCYEGNQLPSKTPIMTVDDLRILVSKLLSSSSDRLLLYIHGGEPLLAGMAWFKELTSIVSNHGANGRVEFGVQTNGTLLTPQWVEFFVENRFNVGLSLDGPPELHDGARVDHSGRGTFRRVIAALRLLQQGGARHGVTAVLTEHHSNIPNCIPNLFRFFLDEGVQQLDIHPAWSPNPSLSQFNLSPASYSRSLAQLFDEWLRAGRVDVLVRTFEFFFQGMAKARPAACHRAGACMSILGVEPDGTVVPCVRPFPKEYTFGNLLESALAEVIQGEAFERFAKEEAEGQTAKYTCRWGHLCGGGCPHERYSDGRSAIAGRHAHCTCGSDETAGYPGLFEHLARRTSAVLSARP